MWQGCQDAKEVLCIVLLGSRTAATDSQVQAPNSTIPTKKNTIYKINEPHQYLHFICDAHKQSALKKSPQFCLCTVTTEYELQQSTAFWWKKHTEKGYGTKSLMWTIVWRANKGSTWDRMTLAFWTPWCSNTPKVWFFSCQRHFCQMHVWWSCCGERLCLHRRGLSSLA